MRKKTSLLFLCIVLLSGIFTTSITVYAQTSPTPTPSSSNSSSADDLRKRITELEGKVSELKGQEKTLSMQITTMDNNMKLTQMKIDATKQQISDLQKGISIAADKIGKMESSLTSVSQVLLNRIQANYVTSAKTSDSLGMILGVSDVSDYVLEQQYLDIIQKHDRELVYEVQQTKNNYENQKQIFSDQEQKQKDLQTQLTSYTQQLEADKKNKQTLLTQTQGSEANYQKLLEQAQAQLAGFSNFTANQGGAGLLSGQTSCDDWGCYYNQRDTQWGGVPLNGTKYTIASDGCLVTSMAMVLTHYGHKSVTPLSINSNPSNFASYYPAYLLFTISVDGVTAQRVSASIDSTLAHDPVVVGVHAYGGTHFVVLTSGSHGSYKMRDPYIANGKDVNFTDHYTVGSIFEIDKVVL